MKQINQGGKQEVAQNGKIVIDYNHGQIKFYDDSNNEVMTMGDVTDHPIAANQYGIVFEDINGNDKMFLGPKSSGNIETYFAGKLACALTGGTLDGTTYSKYILTIKLYHHFSEHFPLFQALFDWWGQEQFASSSGVRTRNKTLPQLAYTGGSANETLGSVVGGNIGFGEMTFLQGSVDSNDPANPNTEYMEWILTLSRVSGTIVIPPQTFYLVVYLYYLNQVLPTLTSTPTYAQGGGGGVLSESLNFFI